MTNAEKRFILRVGFRDLLPRTKWASGEFAAVSLSVLIAVVTVGGTFAYGQHTIAGLESDDRRVNIERREIAARVAPLRIMNERLKIAAQKAPLILATRQSGLNLAERVVKYGDAIGRDGVATTLDSQGRIDGIAPDFAAVSRIWGRLGESVMLTAARPVTGTVRFSFVQSAPAVAPAPASPVVTNGSAAAAAGSTTQQKGTP